MRPRQNCRHFPFKFIFLEENYCILLQISLTFLSNGPNYNKPLSEPMAAYCSDIWVTRSQRVNPCLGTKIEGTLQTINARVFSVYENLFSEKNLFGLQIINPLMKIYFVKISIEYGFLLRMSTLV